MHNRSKSLIIGAGIGLLLCTPALAECVSPVPPSWTNAQMMQWAMRTPNAAQLVDAYQACVNRETAAWDAYERQKAAKQRDKERADQADKIEQLEREMSEMRDEMRRLKQQ